MPSFRTEVLTMDEMLQALAVMHLQTAFFHPTAEGSCEAFKKYLETQQKIMEQRFCAGYLASVGIGARLSSGYIRPDEPAPTPSIETALGK